MWMDCENRVSVCGYGGWVRLWRLAEETNRQDAAVVEARKLGYFTVWSTVLISTTARRIGL